MSPVGMVVLLSAHADDHAAPVLHEVTSEPASIPDGPPKVVSVGPNEDLQAAIDALPAGSTIRLSSGTHRGHIRIDRPLELSGEPGAAIDGTGTGTVVSILADDVWIHDVRVTGGGSQPQGDDSAILAAGDRFRIERVTTDHVYLGIDVRSGDDGVIRGCAVLGDPQKSFGLRGDGIRLWETTGTLVEDNRLEHVRDLVVWYSDHNQVHRNVVLGSRYGTHLMHTTGNRIWDNKYEDNVVGVFVMYSDTLELEGNVVAGSHGEAGVGLGFKESSGIVARGNTLVDDTTAIYLDTTPHRADSHATFERNLVGANQTALRFHGRSGGAAFVDNDFRGNRTLAQVDGHVSLEGVRFEHNHWSDYAGYDLDRDGVGDVVFEARQVSAYIAERFPNFQYFVGTPAQALVELFASAFPMFAPETLFSDPRPVMEAP